LKLMSTTTFCSRQRRALFPRPCVSTAAHVVDEDASPDACRG
jgi:hypothetical protein